MVDSGSVDIQYFPVRGYSHTQCSSYLVLKNILLLFLVTQVLPSTVLVPKFTRFLDSSSHMHVKMKYSIKIYNLVFSVYANSYRLIFKVLPIFIRLLQFNFSSLVSLVKLIFQPSELYLISYFGF